jgi:hypothetical protein
MDFGYFGFPFGQMTVISFKIHPNIQIFKHYFEIYSNSCVQLKYFEITEF